MNRFYKTQSIYSDPGQLSLSYADLPYDISKLRASISNLFLHYADMQSLGVHVPLKRYHETNLRYISCILKKIYQLESTPLSNHRIPTKRILGICRDSALLMCSILRSRGIAARLRCGYVTYFIRGFYLDGLCVEYLDKYNEKWISVDTRTTQQLISKSQLLRPVNFSNLSSLDFIPAAKAWQLYRLGRVPANRFGSRTFQGVKVIRNRMIQDFLCLLKFEPLIWDVWGGMLNPDGINEKILDKLSILLLTQSDELNALRSFYYASPDLKIKENILVDHPFLKPSYISVNFNP